jgi:hypothetical protein
MDYQLRLQGAQRSRVVAAVHRGAGGEDPRNNFISSLRTRFAYSAAERSDWLSDSSMNVKLSSVTNNLRFSTFYDFVFSIQPAKLNMTFIAGPPRTLQPQPSIPNHLQHCYNVAVRTAEIWVILIQ